MLLHDINAFYTKNNSKNIKSLMYNNLEKLYNGVTGSHGWNLERLVRN